MYVIKLRTIIIYNLKNINTGSVITHCVCEYKEK